MRFSSAEICADFVIKHAYSFWELKDSIILFELVFLAFVSGCVRFEVLEVS